MRTIRISSSLARRYPRALRGQREQAELRRHESLRPAAAASALLVMALMLGACADSDSSALPDGDSTTTAVSTSADPATESTDSPSPTETGWESDFTADQLAEYDEALARWEDYEDESAPLWADPKPSPETLNFFASYFYNENFMQQRLTDYQSAEIVVTGAVTVLWSKAIRIRGKAVTIRQCVDYSTLHATTEGKPLEPVKGSVRREIDLSKPVGSAYLISRTRDAASGVKAQPCGS